MRKLLKIVAILAAIVLVVIGVSLFSLYEASQLVPGFYHQAMQADPARQREARDAFVAQATALISDLNQEGRWTTLFTAEQINAWFDLELAKNYPDLLPGELCDPRISFSDKQATIACRFTQGEMAAVLSLTLDVYLQEPNVLALRIRRARAGALPVPLSQVLDGISHAARKLDLRVEWRKSQGDPVALITLPRPRDSDALALQSLELRDGELFASGTIATKRSISSPEPPQPVVTPTAEHDAVPESQPLVGAAEKETRQK